MISERTPEVADEVVRRLGQEEPVEGCLGELQAAATELDQKEFWWRPAWAELHVGRLPPQSETREPGEWPHGWQYWASSVLDTHFWKNSMLTNRTTSRKPTCARTLVEMLESFSRTRQRQESSPSLLTCSGFCCWSACNFRCP